MKLSSSSFVALPHIPVPLLEVVLRLLRACVHHAKARDVDVGVSIWTQIDSLQVLSVSFLLMLATLLVDAGLPLKHSFGSQSSQFRTLYIVDVIR